MRARILSLTWQTIKKLGSCEQIFAKISVFGAEILPKPDNGPKNAEIFSLGSQT